MSLLKIEFFQKGFEKIVFKFGIKKCFFIKFLFVSLMPFYFKYLLN